jgi:uncharacterized DUF497 family protein
MECDGFDCDGGNLGKCQKHSVSRDVIERLFFGTPFVGPDVAHSLTEQRFRAIGGTAEGRRVFVVFTWRRKGESLLIRPLSARFMHRKEIQAYEQARAKDVP